MVLHVGAVFVWFLAVGAAPQDRQSVARVVARAHVSVGWRLGVLCLSFRWQGASCAVTAVLCGRPVVCGYAPRPTTGPGSCLGAGQHNFQPPVTDRVETDRLARDQLQDWPHCIKCVFGSLLRGMLRRRCAVRATVHCLKLERASISRKLICCVAVTRQATGGRSRT